MLTRLLLLLLVTTCAFAEGAPVGPSGPVGPAAPGAPGAGGGMAAMLPTFLFLGIMVAFMYFFIIRPQQKEEKRRKQLIDSLKRGDDVVTIGGVHGEVVTVGEATVEIKVGLGKDGTVCKFNRGAIQENLTANRVAEAEKKSKDEKK